MKRISLLLSLLLLGLCLGAQERVPVWPKGKMPDTFLHKDTGHGDSPVPISICFYHSHHFLCVFQCL